MTDEDKMTSQRKARVVMLSAALAQSNQNMLMLINALKMTKLSPRQREFIHQATAQLAALKNTLAKADESKKIS
jgi:hypothetical protein